ncbi:MAG: hypothetical protein Kow0059_04390 [Candidatus Sumerlaeia bacterium]
MPVVLGIVLIFAANRAPAVSLYPLVYTTRHTTASTELHILPPFFEARTSGPELFWGLHPLVSQKIRRDSGHSDLLWTPPLGWSRRTPEVKDETGRSIKHVKFLYVFHWKRWTDFYGFERTDFWIVPFWFSGRSEDGGFYYILFPFFWYANGIRQSVPLPGLGPQHYKAVFPLWGDFYNVMLMDRIFTALFPLYVYERKNTMRGHSVLWPVFGFNKGEQFTSWRAWPLIGHSAFANGRRKWYVLWPLIHWWTKPTDPAALERDDASAQVILPFFARVDGRRIRGWGIPLLYGRFDRPQVRSRGYMPPLLVYREHDEKRFKEWNLLWLVGRYRWGGESWVRLWPLFSVRNESRSSGWYALWPFIQFNKDVFPDYTRALFFILPFYYDKTWDHKVGSRQWPGGGRETVRLFWPLFKYERLPDGSKTFNLLWLFWFRKWDAMEWNWVPLWTIYSYRHDAAKGTTDWQILRPLLWGRRTPQGRISEFNFLGLQYRNENGEKRLGLLFRKLSVKLPF